MNCRIYIVVSQYIHGRHTNKDESFDVSTLPPEIISDTVVGQRPAIVRTCPREHARTSIISRLFRVYSRWKGAAQKAPSRIAGDRPSPFLADAGTKSRINR